MGAGELLCIVGPSGCGKTTLLKCVAGLLRPSGGLIEMDGVRVTSPSPSMAVVFQEYGRSLYPWLTVRGNVELPLRHKKLPRQRRDRLVNDALEAVGLAHATKSYPWQLSGGMQQRVAIARAIAYEPEMLVMDEPFAAVDAQTRTQLQADLLRLWNLGRKTIIFVTHDITEAIALGDRALVLSRQPTRIAAEHPIPIPRPRKVEDIFALEGFAAVYERIRAAIQ
jgi:NitT/TauT family transport system ATP-binding protein